MVVEEEEEAGVVVEEEEEAEVAEAEAEGELRQAAQLPEEEATQNSSEQNHPHSTEIARTSTDSYRISKGICR